MPCKSNFGQRSVWPQLANRPEGVGVLPFATFEQYGASFTPDIGPHAQELTNKNNHSYLSTLLLIPALAVFLPGEVLFFLNRFTGAGPAFPEAWFLLITSLAETSIAVLILRRLPTQRVGWLLYAIGMLLGASYLLDEYGIYALQTAPGSLPFGRLALVMEGVGSVAFGLTAAYLPLLFPSGHLPSRRWRMGAYVAGVAIVGTAVAHMLRPFPAPFDKWTNPLAIASAEGAVAVLTVSCSLVVAAYSLAGLAALVVRFRAADGIEKRQLEWFGLSALVLLLVTLLSLVLSLAGLGSDSIRSVLFSVGFAAVPASVAVAILRYHLYDIDWIVSRTLVYVPLTAILAGLYVASTGLARTLFTEATAQNSDFSVALSTLVVVGALTPVKNQLQAWVDGHFKESRDPEHSLAGFMRQANGVMEVLSEPRFVRRFLRELVLVFNAEGGAIYVGSRSYTEGQTSYSAQLLSEFGDAEGLQGRVELGSRMDGLPYSGREMATFLAHIALLDQVSALWPHREDQVPVIEPA